MNRRFGHRRLSQMLALRKSADVLCPASGAILTKYRNCGNLYFMSEQDPFHKGKRPLWQKTDVSGFEVWESLEGLKEMINHVLAEQPRSALAGDQCYCAAFGLIVEEDDVVATTGYEYEGEFVELVEDVEEDQEPYVVLKDVCCFVSPEGDYEPKDPEQFYRDTMFIARHTIMQVPISQFSSLLMSVRSKAEMEAEFAKYRSPADLL